MKLARATLKRNGAAQRVWPAGSLNRTGLEEEPQGQVRMAMVLFEKVLVFVGVGRQTTGREIHPAC